MTTEDDIRLALDNAELLAPDGVWAEWVLTFGGTADIIGKRLDSVCNGRWVIRTRLNEGGWSSGVTCDDHTALCLIERHWETKLRQEHGIGISWDPQSRLWYVYRAKANKTDLDWLAPAGGWHTALSAEKFPSRLAAILAATKATNEET